MATIEEVKTQLEELTLGVVIGEGKMGGENRQFINIHADDSRVPTDTIWPPHEANGWIWGDNFQYSADRDDDALTVADKIAKTLHARGIRW